LRNIELRKELFFIEEHRLNRSLLILKEVGIE